MQDQLQKAINLAKKTGDRLIVFDSSRPNDVYVVMSLKDYENLVLGRSEVRNLTEDELLDRINRDIAIWKSEQDFEELDDEENSNWHNEIDNMSNIGSMLDRKIKRAKKSTWSIPSNVKQHAEEVIEEDRQYLQDVPF